MAQVAVAASTAATASEDRRWRISGTPRGMRTRRERRGWISPPQQLADAFCVPAAAAPGARSRSLQVAQAGPRSAPRRACVQGPADQPAVPRPLRGDVGRRAGQAGRPLRRGEPRLRRPPETAAAGHQPRSMGLARAEPAPQQPPQTGPLRRHRLEGERVRRIADGAPGIGEAIEEVIVFPARASQGQVEPHAAGFDRRAANEDISGIALAKRACGARRGGRMQVRAFQPAGRGVVIDRPNGPEDRVGPGGLGFGQEG